MTLIMLKTFSILYLFLSHGYGFQEETSRTYEFDNDKGIVMYDDGPVYIYDAFIYIPVVISIPYPHASEQDESNTTALTCDISSSLNSRINEVIRILQSKLPSLRPIERGTSTDTLVIAPRKVIINHQNPGSKLSVDESLYGPKIINLNNIDHSAPKRRRRFVIMLTLVVLGLLAVTAATGAITGSIALAKVSHIENNQQKIVKAINEQAELINIISTNQEKVLSITQNITLRMNRLIRDHECLKLNTEEQLRLLNTWSNIVPNSFLRAVNSILKGDVNLDIIPGDHMQTIIKLYPAFSNTIFEDVPLLFYQCSKSKFIKILVDPLTIEGLLVVPKILKRPFGRRIVQKSCTWKHKDKYFSLLDETTVIKSLQDQSWWDPTSCIYQEGVTLCDKKKLKPSNNGCFGKGRDWNIDQCKIKKEPRIDPNQVIQTPHGIVVCNKDSHVTAFKADFFGVINTNVLNITGPTYISNKLADSILVNHLHYSINHEGPIINISHVYLRHNNIVNMSEFDQLSPDFNITHVKKLDDLVLTNPYYHVLHIVTGLFMIGILGGCGFFLYKYRVKEQKMKRRVGLVSYKLHNLPIRDSSVAEIQA